MQTEVSSKASVTELDSVETNLQNQIDTKISRMACPTDSPGYHLVGNKCIYYEQTSLNWENAKKGCKDKFSGGGRLFQPFSLQENNDVAAIIKRLYSKLSNFWIGVDDLSQEGSFTYSSSGSKISFNLPWHEGTWENSTPWGRRGSGYNCVLMQYNSNSNATWLDYDCKSTWLSVCESELQSFFY